MSVLVTGANRGIGLEFVRQLVQHEKSPKYVFATYRSKGTIQELEKIKESSKKCQVILIQVDVTKKEEVQSLRKSIEGHVGDRGLNLLINNAGALKLGSYKELGEEDMVFHFKTNTVGPVIVFKEMQSLLEEAVKSKENVLNLPRTTVLNISSMVGSVADSDQLPMEILEPSIAYKISKAALNMAMRCISIVLKDKDILMVNLCPGWVRTDMGTSEAELDVSESVSSMLKTLPGLDKSRHGQFMDRHGQNIAY